MQDMHISKEKIMEYREYLYAEERSTGTVDKYMRDLQAFVRWLNGKAVSKEVLIQWKEHLQAQHYAPVTINSMLAALNGLFRFLGWEEYRIKFLKIQRRLFRDATRELTRPEFHRLLATAQSQGQEQLALLMETICTTGIRVSEVKYITVEAAKSGRTEISLKGKIRTILLPRKLTRKLLRYAEKNKTVCGEIFLTANGKSLARQQIWAEMKNLCKRAGVEPSKVFPHNLRHLFATAFYQICKDIVLLADVLGHSSIETTRIYLITSGDEHARQLEKLRFVS